MTSDASGTSDASDTSDRYRLVYVCIDTSLPLWADEFAAWLNRWDDAGFELVQILHHSPHERYCVMQHKPNAVGVRTVPVVMHVTDEQLVALAERLADLTNNHPQRSRR